MILFILDWAIIDRENFFGSFYHTHYSKLYMHIHDTMCLSRLVCGDVYLVHDKLMVHSKLN